MTLVELVNLLCKRTADMASLGHRKGSIKEGYDADFVIWDPDASYTVCMILYFISKTYYILFEI